MSKHKKNTSYLLDEFAKNIARIALALVFTNKEEVQAPIRNVFLVCEDLELWPRFLVLEMTNDETLTLYLDGVEGKHPEHIDFLDDDDPLSLFIEKNELDEDELQWGDNYNLPAMILTFELESASNFILHQLPAMGILIDAEAKSGAMFGDEIYTTSPDEIRHKLHKEFPNSKTRNDFYSLFYGPSRYDWSSVLPETTSAGANKSQEYNSRINVQDGNGRTLLHLACQNENVSEVEALIDRGAEINIWDSIGFTPAHIAVNTQNIEIVKFLTQRFDLSLIKDRDRKGNLLHLAVQCGNLEIIRILMEARVSVNDVDNDGWGVLSFAIMNGDIELVKLLIDKGANVNHVNSGGYTPICTAVHVNNQQICTLLLDEGADINHVTNEGTKAINYTQDKNLIDFLVSRGAIL